jgi:glycine oxidase
MLQTDVCIAGAGIIGLSLALELHRKGARVAVFDQGTPLAEASTAAAGMLAAYDPENDRRMLELSKLSLSLYPGFLQTLFDLSGILVPFHTSTTLQGFGAGHKPLRNLPALTHETLQLLVPGLNHGAQQFILLSENSVDPRELSSALLAAVRATPISLHTHAPVRLARSGDGEVEVHSDKETVTAGRFVDCTGAWAFTNSIDEHLRPAPRKGQMLSVAMTPSMPLHLVIRTPDIYIVPRTASPDRARLVIGATVEDAGFDKSVHQEDIARLRALATELYPALAEARELETWAGLRPATTDRLPLLGQVSPNHFIASGHYRNGILQAPATACVMAQIIAGERPETDLSAFHPFRDGH